MDGPMLLWWKSNGDHPCKTLAKEKTTKSTFYNNIQDTLEYLYEMNNSVCCMYFGNDENTEDIFFCLSIWMIVLLISTLQI